MILKETSSITKKLIELFKPDFLNGEPSSENFDDWDFIKIKKENIDCLLHKEVVKLENFVCNVDVVEIPYNLISNQTILNRFNRQPVSMMILSHSKVLSTKGKELQNHFEKIVSVSEIVKLYKDLCIGFLTENEDGRGFLQLSNSYNDIYRKTVSLYRVCCDLYPRIFWMSKKNVFTKDIPDEKMIYLSGLFDVSNYIIGYFQGKNIDISKLNNIREILLDKVNTQ
jgi:hypothetical protein